MFSWRKILHGGKCASQQAGHRLNSDRPQHFRPIQRTGRLLRARVIPGERPYVRKLQSKVEPCVSGLLARPRPLRTTVRLAALSPSTIGLTELRIPGVLVSDTRASGIGLQGYSRDDNAMRWPRISGRRWQVERAGGRDGRSTILMTRSLAR